MTKHQYSRLIMFYISCHHFDVIITLLFSHILTNIFSSWWPCCYLFASYMQLTLFYRVVLCLYLSKRRFDISSFLLCNVFIFSCFPCLLHRNMNAACTLWEDILFQKPKDMLAIKFSHDAYFYLGRQAQMLSSVIQHSKMWTQGMPLYG